MEKLFAYVLLLCEGYDIWDLYSEELDRLFLNDPENEIYLYLESTTDMKRTVFYIISMINKESFDTDIFGQTLMKLISDIYKKSNLKDFSRHMYSLWNNLPDYINNKEPFYTLCYADDSLSCSDEARCRELYEKAMYFYINNNH